MSKKFAAVAALMIAFAHPDASAFFGGGGGGAPCDKCVTGAVDSARNALVSRIGELETRIVEAIKGSTQATTAQQAKAAEMISEAAQRTATTMEQARQDARFEQPDACAVLASTKGGIQDAQRGAGSLGGGVGRGGGGGGRRASGGVTSNMQEALDISAGRVAAPSPEVQATKAVSGACGSFVNGGTVRGQACDRAGFRAAASNGHPDADVRAETLFDGPQRGTTAAEFRRRLTIDPDGEEKQAVEAYLRNVNTPVDLRALQKAELQTDAGRQYLAFRDAYEARMSMAEKPARALAANRMANPALIPVIQQLLTSDVTGAFTKSYLDKNAPRWSQRGISVDELFALEGERRYLNRDWHLKMASLPPEAHVKEQTTMQALQVLMLARVSEKLDMIATLNGGAMASNVRTEMLPQLIELHKAASK